MVTGERGAAVLKRAPIGSEMFLMTQTPTGL